jgi:alpha-beta hydrolase superfamily lysophospholipase
MGTPREELRFVQLAGHSVAAVFHHAEPESRRLVVMAHGFKSSKIGPSRYFVDLARALAERGVSTFRFDQPGSGDAERAFEESSFTTWIDTIEHAVRMHHDEGASVALLGQSMGGRAALAAAVRLGDTLRGLALWSPGPMLNVDFSSMTGQWMEEDGQRVSWDFWREAAQLDFLDLYRRLDVPADIVFGTADHLIPVDEMRTFAAECKPGDRIRLIEGLPHSAWPEPPRLEILSETADTLVSWLAGT